MKIVTIVGARPQFIKAAAVSRAISEYNRLSAGSSPPVTEVIVHTGQHYDDNMSAVFFQQLEIPPPDMNLHIGSGTHARQTGQMLMAIEDVLVAERPDWVLVYGDTNSTLAGALAAGKLHLPVAHVEAGLRSHNRKMPEEINRVLTDHLAGLLFCPTRKAVENLEAEGINRDSLILTGDVMYDSLLFNLRLAEKKSKIIEKLHLEPGAYALATVHRAENTDNTRRLQSIFEAFAQISDRGLAVVIPLHPRTAKMIAESGIETGSIHILEPAGYLDMLMLAKQAKMILTDSGGLQKEAYWMKVPCVTLRDETEWTETVESGWNVLAGADSCRIVELVQNRTQPGSHNPFFGDGRASEKIVAALVEKKAASPL